MSHIGSQVPHPSSSDPTAYTHAPPKTKDQPSGIPTPSPMRTSGDPHDVKVVKSGGVTQPGGKAPIDATKPDNPAISNTACKVLQNSSQQAAPPAPLTENHTLAQLPNTEPNIDALFANLEVDTIPEQNSGPAVLSPKQPESDLAVDLAQRLLDNLDRFNGVRFDENGDIQLTTINPSDIANLQHLFDKSTGQFDIPQSVATPKLLEKMQAFSQTYCMNNNLPIPKQGVRILSDNDWNRAIIRYTASMQNIATKDHSTEKQERTDKSESKTHAQVEANMKNVKHVRTNEKGHHRERNEKSVAQTTTQSELRTIENRIESERFESQGYAKTKKRSQQQHDEKVEAGERKREERNFDAKKNEIKKDEKR